MVQKAKVLAMAVWEPEFTSWALQWKETTESMCPLTSTCVRRHVCTCSHTWVKCTHMLMMLKFKKHKVSFLKTIFKFIVIYLFSNAYDLYDIHIKTIYVYYLKCEIWARKREENKIVQHPSNYKCLFIILWSICPIFLLMLIIFPQLCLFNVTDL